MKKIFYKIGMFLINPNKKSYIFVKVENKTELEVISNLDYQDRRKLIKALYQKI